jgi:hypothetical protein
MDRGSSDVCVGFYGYALGRYRGPTATPVAGSQLIILNYHAIIIIKSHGEDSRLHHHDIDPGEYAMPRQKSQFVPTINRFPQQPNHLRRVFRPKHRAPRHNDIRARLGSLVNRPWSQPSVHLDVEVRVPLPQLLHLWQLRRHGAPS